MSGPHWDRIKEVFQQALDRPPLERAAWLHEVCGDDRALLAEVESLLTTHDEAGSFAERPAIELLGQLGLDEASRPIGSVGRMLHPGDRLGVYEIHALLGAGGMGEVYRARDTELGRDVAIKVLPAAFVTDRERLARFEREARLLAALSHPNIGAIYGLEEAAGVRALVLELVEGLTLAERLERGAMAVSEALPIAKQIADALEAAHEKGIVHRDLKPANIILTRDARVKVLDFGLAKAIEDGAPGEAPQLPTATIGPTQVGVIRGTPGYMSPEQVRGLITTRQSDVWAFGCVLYELLTGKQAFRGETVSETMAAVLASTPDLGLLPTETPDAVVRLLRRCLQKDPKHRLRDIGDARIELEDSSGAPIAGREDKQRLSHRTAIAVAAAAAFGALAGALVFSWWSVPTPAPVERLSIVMPPDHTLLVGPSVAISRDGRRVAYVAERDAVARLFVRDLGEANAHVLVETGQPLEPFFSPDGESIGFFADKKLKTIGVAGGTPLVLCDAVYPLGGSWGADGLIVFAPTATTPLFQISASGGIPKPLTTLDVGAGEAGHRWPQLLPDNHTVLFAAGPAGSQTNFNQASIQVQSLETGRRQVVAARGTYPRLVAGHLLYVEGDSIFARRFDMKTLAVVGAPMAVLEDVDSGVAGQKPFEMSANGTVVYVAGTAARPQPMFMLESSGTLTQLPFAPARFLQPKISPDGRRVAVGIADADTDVWVYDIAGGARTRVTSSGSNRASTWSHDGRRVIYAAARGATASIFWRAADASAPEEELVRIPGFPSTMSLLPDDHTLIISNPTDGQTLKVDLADAQHPRPWLDSPGDFVTVSPDGELAAYVSNQAGRPDVYVRPSSGKGGPVPVSIAAGYEPAWAHSGRELFFLDWQENVLMAVSVETKPALTVSRPRRVIPSGTAAANVAIDTYDVMPDDRHFLVIQSNSSAGQQSLSIITNWFRELNARVR